MALRYFEVNKTERGLDTSTGNTAYHYTSKEELPGILRYGLIPSRTLETSKDSGGLPDFAYDKYTFGFLDESKPTKWADNPEFPDVFEQLMGNIGSVLGLHFMFRDFMLDDHMANDLVRVSFPILQSDQAYLVDWAKCERHRKTGIPHHANRDYALSRVPLSEYQDQHDLPELIIANPIPAHRLRIDRQPFQSRRKLIEIVNEKYSLPARTF